MVKRVGTNLFHLCCCMERVLFLVCACETSLRLFNLIHYTHWMPCYCVMWCLGWTIKYIENDTIALIVRHFYYWNNIIITSHRIISRTWLQQKRVEIISWRRTHTEKADDHEYNSANGRKKHNHNIIKCNHYVLLCLVYCVSEHGNET